MTMRGTASILSNVVVLLVGVMSSFGRHNHSFCDGYQLVINNTAPGAYLQNITNIVVGGVTTEEEDAVEVIGALYHDVIYDNKGNRLDHALHQGYLMYSQDKEGLINYNDIYYFQDDDGTVSTMNVFNSYIMSANGTYTPYSGGTISLNVLHYDPAYIAEVTLMEPPTPTTTTDTDADETMTLRITDEGGWNKRINHDGPVVEDDDNIELDVDGGRDGAVIGMRFQDNVIDTDGTNNTVLGINTGFFYRFPKQDGIDATNWNTNRQIIMHNNDGDGDTDGTILIFNDVIVYATGKYSQFVGPFVKVVVPVSNQQPYFIADMTLSKSTTTNTQDPPSTNDDDDNDGSYNFIIKAEGGFFSSIDDVLTGDPIGERFQNPIIDPNGTRIGTNQGYAFNFPMPAAEFNLTTTLFQENRRLFFHDGSIMEIFNGYIVSASGNYTKYQGGQFLQNVISDSPNWAAEVTLIPPKPKTTTNTDNNNDSNEEEGDKEKQEEEAMSSSSFEKYNQYSFMVTVAAAFYGYQ